MPSRRLGGWLRLALAALLAAGCAGPSASTNASATRFTEKDLDKIFDAYQKASAESKQQEEARRKRAVPGLQVEKPAGAAEHLVSVQLSGASLMDVVEDILKRSGVPYVLEDAVLRGAVTARFEKVPLLEALNLLLNAQGYHAVRQRGILHIRPGAPPAPAAQAPPAGRPGGPAPAEDRDSLTPGHTFSTELVLSYLDSKSAAEIVKSLFYPLDSSSSAKPEVRIGLQTSRNRLVLSGRPEAVLRAKRIVQRMDENPAHVIIEVLVLSVKGEAIERLSLDFQNYARNKFSQLTTNLGSLTGNAVTFLYDNAANNGLKFNAVLDVLYSKDLARVISRPYLATLSGHEASLEIAEDRHVVVQTVQSGGTVTTTQPIKSGVILKIVPVVVTSGEIQMRVNVEQSEFVPTAQNVSVAVDKNNAATAMQVQSGQSIIIGGLTLKRATSSNAGLPWVRHVPILNIFAANQQRTEVEREILILVTPYVYSPGMTLPIPDKDLFQNDPRYRKLTPTERGETEGIGFPDVR